MTAAAEAEVEAVVGEEAAPQEAPPAEALPDETAEALAQAPEDAQAAGGLVDALDEAVSNGETITTEIIGGEAPGQMLVITTELENAEATAQPESDVPAKKPAPKGKSKKGAALAGSADK